MSLDIYLHPVITCDECGHKIRVPDIDRDLRWNITHNLGVMAGAAGLYDLLWRENDDPPIRAKDLIPSLLTAITDMSFRPNFYRQYDSPNGWGTYDDFYPALQELLRMCINNPNYIVEVSK